MHLVKLPRQFDINHIYFCDPIKNNIMNDGYFIRIIYSTSHMILNGINLLLTLNDIRVEKYYTKYQCFFNVNLHKELIEQIKTIEEEILKGYNIYNKIPQFKVFEQLRCGNIKIFSENVEIMDSDLFMLKISGIWETETQYGITYKFSKLNRV